MADNIPSLPGGIPPRPPEQSKVQPKKETVRINLPPKPSAAPTIKLPTLPPGGPGAATGAPAFTPAPAAPAAPAAHIAKPAPAAPAGPSGPKSGVTVRSAPAPLAPSLSGVDKTLAIVAAVAGLAAVGTSIFCWTLFKP